MKKVMSIILLISVIILTFIIKSVDIYGSENIQENLLDDYYKVEADRLNEMGLFSGTDIGYELDIDATRAMGAVMLVRFMGVENQAKTQYNTKVISHSFTDVPEWADPHVAYLYEHGMTNGISDFLFGSDNQLTTNQYITMLLRMLNYEDNNIDFNWNHSVEFMESTYLMETRVLNNIQESYSDGMSRGLLVELSYIILDFEYKNSSVTVFEQLYGDGVITTELFSKYYEHLDEFNIEIRDVVDEQTIPSEADSIDEIKGVWFSYIELKPMLLNRNEIEFRESISEAFNQVKEIGFNKVYIQVRPFSDAIYPSRVYPWSNILTGSEGVDPGYDPLNVCIEEARNRDLSIEAWINPYRVRTDISEVPLSENSSIVALMNSVPNSVVFVNNWVTLNPAVEEVRELIVDGVVEIITNYDVDGIQFDDYFYPGNDMSLDLEEYEKYISNGGVLGHSEFRRAQTTKLVKEVHDVIKSVDSDIIFGISPQGSMENNLELVFIDPREWIREGYVDYLMPQIYYGFKNSHSPFTETINEWNDLVEDSDCQLIIGLAGYKVGRTDSWAGEGLNEWIETDTILANMVSSSRELNKYKGVGIFRYSSLFEPDDEVKTQIEKEVLELQKMFMQ